MYHDNQLKDQQLDLRSAWLKTISRTVNTIHYLIFVTGMTQEQKKKNIEQEKKTKMHQGAYYILPLMPFKKYTNKAQILNKKTIN